MVKSVVIDETQFKSTETRLFTSNPPSEIGLIVGKLNPSSDRAFLFDLIPTPPNDDGHPPSSLSSPKPDPKKKPSKSKSQSQSDPPLLLLDTDWIAEHARQVSQMLLGGTSVIGIYLWTPESSFNSSQPTILQVIKAVTPSSSSDSIVLHICYSPSKLVVRNCVAGTSSLRICDFKMGRVLGSLRTFKCLYNFEIRLPVLKEGSFRDVIREGISRHERELRNAKAIVDGDLVVDEEIGVSDGSHMVELLLPVTRNDLVGGVKGEILGVVVFSGFVCAMAYSSPKETIGQGVSDIKADIITSLQSRLNIICDAAEEAMEATGNDGVEQSVEVSNETSMTQLGLRLLKKPTSLAFPRRVLVPWIGDVYICDYLQPMETFDVVRDHCKELMSMEAPANASLILEPEEEAISLRVKSFRDVVMPSNSVASSVSNSMVTKERDSAQNKGSKAAVKPAAFSIVIAIAILLLAILIGYLFYSS